MAKKSKTKPLSALRDKSKGTVSHVTIHPATNSKGGMGFITHTHRFRPEAQQAAMDAGGPYTPAPEPLETPHEDGQDMLDHVGKQLGVQPDADMDED